MSDVKTELNRMLATASAPPAPSTITDGPIPPIPPVPAPVPSLIKVTSVEEFNRYLANASGPIAVLWTQTDCDFCVDDKKALEELAAKCPGNLTALEVSTDSDELNDLAEKWDVDGTPTLLYAKTVATMTPDDSEEVDAKGLRRRLKCVLPRKGSKK